MRALRLVKPVTSWYDAGLRLTPTGWGPARVGTGAGDSAEAHSSGAAVDPTVATAAADESAARDDEEAREQAQAAADALAYLEAEKAALVAAGVSADVIDEAVAIVRGAATTE